jgi:hypothetical protein
MIEDDMNQPQDLDLVALTADRDTTHFETGQPIRLLKGQVGTVVMEYDDQAIEVEFANNDGTTPLHSAAFFCRVEIVQMLIDVKADKTVRNNFGATPIETVSGPFSEIKPVYEMMQQQLSPLGMDLDMEQLEKTRPVIAMMLQ